MQAEGQKMWGAWGQANGLYSSWAASRNMNYHLLFVLYVLDGQEAMTQKITEKGTAYSDESFYQS